jgi:hypothetical protein
MGNGNPGMWNFWGILCKAEIISGKRIESPAQAFCRPYKACKIGCYFNE